jgi:hypothetical protein
MKTRYLLSKIRKETTYGTSSGLFDSRDDARFLKPISKVAQSMQIACKSEGAFVDEW